MKKLSLLAIAGAVLLLFAACDKSPAKNEATLPVSSQMVEESQAPIPPTPEIIQTARTRPGTTDQLYTKWMSLGVVSQDRRYMNVSNAELCVILNNILHYDRDGIHRYYDVTRDDDYYSDVMSMDAMGIITGSDGYFSPEQPITRERAIVALSKAFGGETVLDGATSYLDDGLISDWAKSACLQCESFGWFTGDSLRPQDSMKQGELLWMLDRIVNDIVPSGDVSGTYYSGIVISGSKVNIYDATIYGSVYIITGGGEVSVDIKNSAITGGIFIGRGIMRGSDAVPYVSVMYSNIGGIYCDVPSNVFADGYIGEMYVDEASQLQLSDTANVAFFVANNTVTVTGGGGISMAIINETATGSSFAAAPKVYFDAPGCYYSGPETGFLVILGKTYLVGDGGELYKGFVLVDDDEYYFDDNGVMATGLMEIDGVGYLFDDNGILQSGFKHVDGGVCYVDLSGNTLTGRNTIGDYDYIFDSAGILQTGLFDFDGVKYIADANGIILTGVIDFESNTYYADETGALTSGLIEYEDQAHWFDDETFALAKNTVIDEMTIDENGVITNFDGGRISSGSEELDAMLDEIVAEVCTEDMTLEEKMWAVYAWTKVNIHYRSTPIDLTQGYTEELVIEHGLNTMNTRRGACEHFAIVNALLFNRLGVKTILIQGYRLSLNNGDWADHTWVLAKTEDNLWYHYDALFEYTNTGVNYSVFKKSDSEMSSHHTWEEDDYPVCDGQTIYDEDTIYDD